MKLFAKYTRINLFLTLLIFLLGSAAFALLLRYVLINQVDEDLRIEKNEIETYINQFHRLPQIIKVHDQQTTYTSVNKIKGEKYSFHTLKEHKPGEEPEDELVREIDFYVNIKQQWYKVSVSKSLEGTDDLIQSIIIITAAVILLILITTFLINRTLLKKLWQPFYNSLKKIETFTVGANESLHFDKSNIDEFELMNKTLSIAVNKAKQDYILLREFTENASHELQTPLAVIRSKLDILIQDERLTETQSQAIQGAYTSLQKLSRMSQSLLLLTKIENRQFSESKNIDLKKTIEDKIFQFNELWQSNNISVQKNLQEAAITFNTELLDVLLNNLLSNATRHNNKTGRILIELKQGELKISNTGNAGSLDTDKLFSRFYKTTASNDSCGLGLSIIKQICEVSGCTIAYRFAVPNLHIFNLQWR